MASQALELASEIAVFINCGAVGRSSFASRAYASTAGFRFNAYVPKRLYRLYRVNVAQLHDDWLGQRLLDPMKIQRSELATAALCLISAGGGARTTQGLSLRAVAGITPVATATPTACVRFIQCSLWRAVSRCVFTLPELKPKIPAIS